MTISVYADLNALPASCDALFAQADAGVFSSLPWYQNFARTVAAQSGRPRIYALTDPANEAAAMVIPMWQTAPSGRFTRRTLEPLANYYTGLFSALGTYAHSRDLLDSWALALMAGNWL